MASQLPEIAKAANRVICEGVRKLRREGVAPSTTRAMLDTNTPWLRSFSRLTEKKSRNMSTTSGVATFLQHREGGGRVMGCTVWRLVRTAQPGMNGTGHGRFTAGPPDRNVCRTLVRFIPSVQLRSPRPAVAYTSVPMVDLLFALPINCLPCNQRCALPTHCLPCQPSVCLSCLRCQVPCTTNGLLATGRSRPDYSQCTKGSLLPDIRICGIEKAQDL